MPDASYNAQSPDEPAPAFVWDTPDHFHSLAQASFDGLMIHENGVILIANQAYADFFSIPSPNTLVGCHGLDVLPFTTESKKLIREHMHSRANDLYEISILRPDGTPAFAVTQGRDIVYLGHRARLVIIRDITACKNAELALRETEINFRALFEGAPEGILVADINSRNLLQANPAICAMLGYSEMELLHLSVDHIHPPEHLPQIFAQFDALAHGEIFRVSNVPCLRKDRSVFHATIASKVVKYAGRQAVVGFFSDTTEHQKAVEALQHSEKLFRRTFDFSPVGMTVLGLNYRFIRCNEAFCHFLGYAEAELIGRTYLDVTFPEDNEIGRSELLAIIAGSLERAQTVKRYVRKDGRVVWGEVNLSLVRNPQGQPLFFLPIIQDVTESRRVMESLRESEEKYRLLVENMNTGVFQSTLAGRFLNMNQAVVEMAGFESVNELMPLPSSCLYADPSDRERLKEVLMLQGEVRNCELRSAKKDGTQYWISMNAILQRDKDGKPDRILGIVNDITERKRSETQLAESRQQLRALLAKLQNLREDEQTRIAREVHDVLGQQITAFKMDNAWLARRIQKIKDEKLRTELQEKLQLTCELTDTMIESVRHISRRLRPSVLDQLGLEPALEHSAREFQENTGILCKITTPKKALMLHPDHAIGIFRIFQEILTNVARHAQATEVFIILKLNGASLTLQISDNGRGIQDQDLQNPNSLGLLGMNERASLMQGQLQIGRGHQHGTTVTLTIPYHNPTVMAK